MTARAAAVPCSHEKPSKKQSTCQVIPEPSTCQVIPEPSTTQPGDMGVVNTQVVPVGLPEGDDGKHTDKHAGTCKVAIKPALSFHTFSIHPSSAIHGSFGSASAYNRLSNRCCVGGGHSNHTYCRQLVAGQQPVQPR
jgi:hypothetical protein